MEVERKTEATDTDVEIAHQYIRGETPRTLAKNYGVSENAIRNSIDRAVLTHQPTRERLNTARAHVRDVIKQTNEALQSGQVKNNSQVKGSYLRILLDAQAKLDSYDKIEHPPAQPRLALTVADLVRINEGKQEAPPDIIEQEAILVEELEQPREKPRHQSPSSEWEDM